MALAYSTTIQDQIAYRLVSRAYSTLSPSEKASLDGSWTSGTLAAGHAFEGLRLLHRYANFLQVDLTAAPPDDWLSWWIWEIVWRASHHINPEGEERAKRHRDDSLRQAITTHTKTAFDSVAQTAPWAVTHAAIRSYVLDACVHMDPPFLPSPEMVDATMRDRFVQLWTFSNWLFRRTPVVLTIATDSTVTSDPSITIDGISSRKLFYTDSNGAGCELIHVTATDMARLRSYGSDAGRPSFFRVTKAAAGALSWEFDRTPDQEYTVRGEAIKGLPTLASSANFDTAIGLLPTDMLDLLRTAIASDVTAKGIRDPSRARLQREEMNDIWRDSLGRMDAVGEPPKIAADSGTRGAFRGVFSGNNRPGPVVGGNL